MKMLAFLLLLSLLVPMVQAQTTLNWQKVELEEKISRKIRGALSDTLNPGQYLVEVDVSFSDPGLPRFEDLNKKNVRVSDVRFDESKGDYIAFSKVGLEVPVVEDMFKENQMRLKELHRFNESYDIFRNIDAVKVDISLSDLLEEKKVELVKNITQKMKLPTGDIKAEFNFHKVTMEMKKVEAPPKLTPAEQAKKDDKLTQKDILDFLSRFGNAIGLILATILFGVIAYFLLKKYEQIKKDLMDKEKEQKEEEKKAEEPAPEEALVEAITPPEEEVIESSSEENIDRFRKFVKASKQESMIMLKRWISLDGELYSNAMKAIAQQLFDDELAGIFQNLNEHERHKWKGNLDRFLTENELKVANKFISEEVVRSMIDPSRIQDIELVDMLLSLNAEVAIKFVTEKKVEGRILMNLLTPQFSGKILNSLPTLEAGEIIDRAMTFDFSEIKDNFLSFKTVLGQYIDSQKRKPMSDKIIQMMPDFNPLKEKMLYSFLAKEGMKEEMENLAGQYLPTELLGDLPKDFLKKLMQNYPMTKKVGLLFTCDEALKNTLMSAFAEEGSTARQMLDLEFDNVKGDKLSIARLESKKDLIMKEFIMFVRDAVKNEKEFASDIDLVINVWISGFFEDRTANAA
ncbi:MAG: hypothetical protein ACOYL6_08195 [Bacteriovoracaceae bacterium]